MMGIWGSRVSGLEGYIRTLAGVFLVHSNYVFEVPCSGDPIKVPLIKITVCHGRH